METLSISSNHINMVQVAMESIGWSVVSADASDGHVRIIVSRHSDGLRLTLDMKPYAASITTEYRSVEHGTHRGLPYQRTRYDLLSRTRIRPSLRSGLKAFADRIHDNSTADRLTCRNAIRLLLQS